jgi:hypothetical protein
MGIWKQRNGLIFESKQPSTITWRVVSMKGTTITLAHKVKPSHTSATTISLAQTLTPHIQRHCSLGLTSFFCYLFCFFLVMLIFPAPVALYM